MPTKRKFSAKFPTARIKKIMQLDDEIGKLSATVPPVVSRALELFVEQLLTKAYNLTVSRNSKTILPIYLKEAIEEEEVFEFLKPIVSHISSSKEADDLKGRTNPGDLEGGPKPRNGTNTRKREIHENPSDNMLSDESGPSNLPNTNGRRKYTRKKRKVDTNQAACS
ncbi:hypothetical protein Aperf_G00000102415 [Anoplocephala perfoliata]